MMNIEFFVIIIFGGGGGDFGAPQLPFVEPQSPSILDKCCTAEHNWVTHKKYGSVVAVLFYLYLRNVEVKDNFVSRKKCEK